MHSPPPPYTVQCLNKYQYFNGILHGNMMNVVRFYKTSINSKPTDRHTDLEMKILQLDSEKVFVCRTKVQTTVKETYLEIEI